MGHNSKPHLTETSASSPSAAAALLPSGIELRSASRVDPGAPHDEKSSADYQAKRRAFIQALARQTARELMAQMLGSAQKQG